MYSNSTPADKAVEDTVWRKRRKKSRQIFIFYHSGQAENLHAPHLHATPTDTSLKANFSVHFSFCFTVCTRTERMCTCTALKGMQSTEMRGTKTFLSPYVSCVFRVHQSRFCRGDTRCMWLSVTSVVQLTVWCESTPEYVDFKMLSTRLLDIVPGSLVPGTCLASHSF